MKKIVLMFVFNIFLHNVTHCKKYYLVDTGDANADEAANVDYSDPEAENMAESMIIKKMDKKDQELFDALPKREKTEVLQILNKDIEKMQGHSKNNNDYFFGLFDMGLKFLKHCTALFLKIISGATGGAAAVLHGEPPAVKQQVCGLLSSKEYDCQVSGVSWKKRN